MSKSLGIKINIDYSDVDKLKAALAKKIPIELDDRGIKNSIKSLERSINNLKKGNKVKLNFDTSAAQSRLNEFRTAYTNLRNDVESGMKFKLDLSEAFSDTGAINIKENLAKMGLSSKQVEQEIEKMTRIANKKDNDYYSKIKKTTAYTEDGANYYEDRLRSLDEYTTARERLRNDSVKDVTVEHNRLKMLKDIAGTTKELYGLQTKQLTADQFDSGIIGTQIEKTRQHLDELKASWQEVTGLSADDMNMVKMAESAGEYSLLMKEAAVARQEQNNYDKETANMLKEVVALENERHKVLQQSEKKGDQEKEVMQNRAKQIEDEISALEKKYSLEDRLNQQQKEQFETVRKANDAERQYSKDLASSQAADKALINAQKQTYKDLESAIKESYQIREKMSDFEAKQDLGTITGKEETRLKGLQKELELKEKISQADIKAAEESGKISKEQSESLQSLERTRKAKLDNVQSLSKERAELQRIDAEYDKIEASIKKVQSLSKDKVNAGRDEARAIDQIIAKEEELQAQIRETISLSGQKNEARERELDTMQDVVQEQKKENDMRQRAKASDNYRDSKAGLDVLTDMISVRTIYNEGKQAFQYLYRNIKQLDDAMVDVRKVADASEEDFSRFERNIFDHASAVGKTAVEYATSVERWLASGYELTDAVKMAEFSTMGAFVGNIDEAAMVDYMSVPLIAYKDFNGTTLEAWDILNAMNEVANNNAVEMDHMGAAYKRAASSAANAGTSFAELTGLIGASQEATRLGGETIGTSLRTMDLNIAKIGARESSGFEKKFDFFKDIGVDITDTNGELNSTYDILEQLQDAWGDLDTVTRTQAGMHIAGARGQAVITALMSNWDKVQKMIAETESQIGLPEGVGSMYDEMAEMEDSLQFKQAALTNSWQEFIHVVTGGKGPFMELMDVAINAIEKMTDLAEDDSFMATATSVAKGLGVLLASLASASAFRIGMDALGKLQAAVFTTGEAFVFAKKAADFTSFGKGLGSALRFIGPLGKLALALAGIVAVMKLLDYFGVDVWGKLATGFSDSTYELKQFNKGQKEALETLSESQDIYGAIDQSRALTQSYADLRVAKEAAAASTGDYTLLDLDEAEYNDFMTKHNALVEEIGAPKDLNITFNNADHIVNQMRRLSDEMDELEIKRMKLDAIALSEGYSGVDPRTMYDSYLDHGKGDVAHRLSTYSSKLKDLATNPYASEAEVASLQHEIRTLRRSQQFKKEALEYYSDDIKMWGEQRAEFDKFYDSYLGRVSASPNGVKVLTEALSDPAIKEMPGMYFKIMDNVAKATKEAEQFGNIQSELADHFSETQHGFQNTGEEAFKSITAIEEKYGDLLNNSQTVNDWLKNKGFDNGIKGLLDTDQEVVEEFINKVLPQAVEETKEFSAQLEDAVIGMSENFNISADKARELMAKSITDRGGFIRDLFSIDQGAAADALGVEREMLMLADAMMNGVDQSVGSLMENIHNSIAGLEGEDLELAIKAGIVTETGEVDLNQIIGDLHGFDQEFLIQIGVSTQDGVIDNIDNLYQTLGLIGESDAAEIGVAFNVDKGLVDIESLKDKVANDEISISAVLDPSTGEVVSMEINKLAEDGSVESTIHVDADTSAARAELAAVQNEEFMAEETVFLKIKTGYRQDTRFGEDERQRSVDFIKNMIEGISGSSEVDIELIPNIIVDGEVNEEALVKAFMVNEAGFEEIKTTINARAELGYTIETPEDLDLGVITDYLDTILDGDWQGAEFIEVLLEIFPNLQLKEPEQSPEEIFMDEYGDLEDMEDIEVHAGVKVEYHNSGVSGGTGKPEDIVPSELTTVWGIVQSGEVTAETIEQLISDMPESISTEYSINTGNSAEAIEQINSILSGMDQDQQVDFLINAMGIEDAELIQEILAATDGDSAETNISLVSTGLEEAETVSSVIDNTDGREASAKFTVDAAEATQSVDEAVNKVSEADGETATAFVDADKRSFDSAMGSVDASLRRYRSTTVYIRGDANHYNSVIDSLKTRTVTVNIRANKTSSQAIGQQLGSSFSASIGSALYGSGRSSNTSVGRSSSKETKVNEDVWRYWSKELFTGLPIEKSMDELNNQLKKSVDNQDELVKLYKKQIELIDRQIAHERDMQKAQQEELQHILSQLSSHGFTADGNRITNLDRAKSFTGDTASDVEKLLGDWKKLYESIDSIDKTISKLELNKFDAKEDIRQAEIKRELERIESRMKQAESLLRSVDNNTSIQKTREGLIGGQDFDLELSVKEQGLNSAIRSIDHLLKSYNDLATTAIEFEENAEEMQGTLEDLRDAILDNADSVIEYREDLNRVRLDRLIGDFDKFNQVMTANADVLASNIEHMKEGLLSGQSLSDLASFGVLDITRKTKLERDYEFRLELERELNNALENYTDKNIDRVNSAANAVLTIESNKYRQLLEMSAKFSEGIAMEPLDYEGIGIDSSYDAAKSNDSGIYNVWKNQLEALTKAYSDEYLQLVQQHESAIDRATSSIDKQAINQQMVLKQLQLQEKLYQDMITWNNKMIEQSQTELENAELTTEQRNQLIDAIEEYRQSNVSAQQSIRDTIASRFDYEFMLMDKVMKRANKYVSSLEHMLDVAELVNMDAKSIAGLYDAIYAGKVNNYSEAKKQLQELASEQANFEEGSYEWGLLNEKIEELTASFRELGVEALNANHDVLNNALDSIQEKFEKGILDDKTLDDFKQHTEQWMTGLEKQLSLEDLRRKSLNVEDDVIKSRLEMLDRQEKVSQKDIEYMDKQLKVLELQGKLDNIGQERNVQTLTKRSDGTFGLVYDFDQSEYDKVQKELNDSQKELEKYRQEQRKAYAEALGSIISRAGEGGYRTTGDLRKSLENLQSVYGTILNDIPDLTLLSHGELLDTYEKYLEANSLLANDVLNPFENLETGNMIRSIGEQFELSFMNISNDFGKVIGNEVKEALRQIQYSNGLLSGGSTTTIHVDTLEFPNVTSSSEIENAILNLKDTTIQRVNQKG